MQKVHKADEVRLIMDVKTRWNSSYLMVERYLKQRFVILATILDPRVAKQDGITGTMADLSDDEVTGLDAFISTMKILYDMTLALCS